MSLNPNQFKQITIQGEVDLLVEQNVIQCQVDSSQATALVPGQAVTMVDSAGGVPKVIAASANTDDVFGFVNYVRKDATYPALSKVEISMFRGNVMYMTASAAIARNAKVMIVVASTKVATATSGKTIVGRALDKATADGDLIRVLIDLPGSAA